MPKPQLRLAEEMLVNSEHLKYAILTMLTTGSSEEAVRPLKEQLFIVQSLDLEVAAFCDHVSKSQIGVEKVIEVTEKIDELVEQCRSFLKVQSRDLAKESLRLLREERRVFMQVMHIREAARS